MTMNVHNLLHLRRSVEQLGPLWANSSFEFEDANADLKSMFHGSQNIDMQVQHSEHHLIHTNSKTFIV